MRRRFVQPLSESIQNLKMRGKHVILSLPFRTFDKSSPDLLIRNAVLRMFRLGGIATHATPPSVRDQLASLAEPTGAEIFDPRKSLCRDGDCMTQVDGVSIYKDDNHLAARQIGILEENGENTLQGIVPAD
jgi:SGNH domain (fused to AT3 domains)